jgi:hypothetical protein
VGGGLVDLNDEDFADKVEGDIGVVRKMVTRIKKR